VTQVAVTLDPAGPVMPVLPCCPKQACAAVERLDLLVVEGASEAAGQDHTNACARSHRHVLEAHGNDVRPTRRSLYPVHGLVVVATAKSPMQVDRPKLREVDLVKMPARMTRTVSRRATISITTVDIRRSSRLRV
jgi:hypothetical protein